jgi:peptide/nickel transport system substrate-binding protein
MRQGSRLVAILVVPSPLARWSGRADPDGNTFRLLAWNQPLNSAGYCNAEADDVLLKARTTFGTSERRSLYERLAALVLKDRPVVYLYHANVLWAYTGKLKGLRAIPDGIVRPQGVRLD